MDELSARIICHSCSLSVTAAVVLLAVLHRVMCALDSDVIIPPIITSDPAPDVYYTVGTSLSIDCEATGHPLPTFRWTRLRNSLFVTIDDNTRIQAQNGTLYISTTILDDEGLYACWAENLGGRTRSNYISLRATELGPMASSKHYAYVMDVGLSVALRCSRPDGEPRPELVWTSVTADGHSEPLVSNERILQSLTGDLYILNIAASDAGRKWQCSAHNPISREVVHGPSYTITPQIVPERSRAAELDISSDLLQTVQVGELASFQCIFVGNPVPRVIWEREGENLPEGRWRVKEAGTLLEIGPVRAGDAGSYSCIGYNEWTTQQIMKTFSLNVDLGLTFVKTPRSLNLTVGGSAAFSCAAVSNPEHEITYTWTINGNEYKNADDHGGRFQLSANSLSVSSAQLSDSMSINCGASYTIADSKVLSANRSAYLSVQQTPYSVISGGDSIKAPGFLLILWLVELTVRCFHQ